MGVYLADLLTDPGDVIDNSKTWVNQRFRLIVHRLGASGRRNCLGVTLKLSGTFAIEPILIAGAR